MSLSTLLLILIAAQTLGTSIFARFEIETPIPRRIFKWALFHAGTIALHAWAGGWALLVPAAFLCLGIAVHIVVCRKYGFHPIYATPRRKYYEFRGWAGPE